MRDLLLIAIVVVGVIVALRRPWIGVLLWTWLSVMNPHRFTFGVAYDAPLAAAAAVSTMLGLLVTRDRSSPLKGAPVAWLMALMLWITLSWLFGLDVESDFDQWSKVMKIDIMIIVGLILLYSKRHILALTWVCAASLAVLGAKGGLFTLATGGDYRVWGPSGSFIADNNEFALALVMTIPLLRFLQLQLAPGWRRHLMTAVMVLCAVSAAGTQSRGALLAISAMALVMWWRGKSRAMGGLAILAVTAVVFSLMPEAWHARMSTITEYETDRSALGRISAWWTAWGVALTHFFGAGFNVARPELFARFSPYPDFVHAAHSIYFQILGNHGFIGLALFLAVFGSTYWYAARLRKEALVDPRANWCADLAAMAQVSLIGFAVGGAFLSLCYFDLPYNIMMLVVLARAWVRQQRWEVEPALEPGWRSMFGFATRTVSK